MTSIFSNIANLLNLSGGQTSMPAGLGPQQPPVQGPPTPTIPEQISQGYTKISEQPGFNGALFKLGTTLLAARENGMGLGQGLVAGQDAFNAEVDRAAKQAAMLAAAKLEREKYNTDTAFKLGEAMLNRDKLAFDQSKTAQDFDLRKQQLGLDKLRLDAQNKMDYLNMLEKAGKIEKDEKERQQAKIEQEYKTGEFITAGEVAAKQIDELLKHPGFTGAVGSGFQKSLPFFGAGDIDAPGGGFTQGSDAADFTERLKQLKGGAFLTAFQSLKGSGAITEIEGKKAESAITRMNLAQSEKEFKTAAEDYKKIITAGVDREKQKAKESGLKLPEQPKIPDATQGGIKFLGFE